MIVKPRRLDRSKLTKKEEKPVIIKAPKKVEPVKVETVKKTPRKPVEEEEKFNFSFDDEEENQ